MGGDRVPTLFDKEWWEGLARGQKMMRQTRRGGKMQKEAEPSVGETSDGEHPPSPPDVLQLLAVYEQRLAEFKREMEELGIKVEVSASFGVYTSIVDEVDISSGKGG